MGLMEEQAKIRTVIVGLHSAGCLYMGLRSNWCRCMNRGAADLEQAVRLLQQQPWGSSFNPGMKVGVFTRSAGRAAGSSGCIDGSRKS